MWSKYFVKEVKQIMWLYNIPDALCNIIASYLLGIYYIKREAAIIFKEMEIKSSSMFLGYNRTASCGDFQWADPLSYDWLTLNCNCGMTFTRCSIVNATLWNLKINSNMFDLFFESHSSMVYNIVVLLEIKVAILLQKNLIRNENRMLSHLYDSLHQIRKDKNFRLWNGLDKYNYGFIGTSSAVLILQHVEDIDNELTDKGYKFGREYLESHRNTLWRNRIFSRQSAQLKQVVLKLMPYAQFSSLDAVNELMRVATKGI
jgi:hypothetical protein